MVCGDDYGTVEVRNEYRRRLNFRGTKIFRFLRFGRPPRIVSSVNIYFEQVLQNRKKMDAERTLAPLSPLYWIGSTKYGR